MKSIAGTSVSHQGIAKHDAGDVSRSFENAPSLSRNGVGLSAVGLSVDDMLDGAVSKLVDRNSDKTSISPVALSSKRADAHTDGASRFEFLANPHTRALATALPLVTSDVLALALAAVFAFAVLRIFGPLSFAGIHRVTPLLAAMLVAGYFGCGMYSVIGINPVVEFRELSRLSTLAFIAIIMSTFMLNAQSEWRVFFTIQWATSLAVLPLFRAYVRKWCAQTAWWGEPAIIFGGQGAAEDIAKLLAQHPQCGVRPVAFYSSQEAAEGTIGDLPAVGAVEAAKLIRRIGISYGVLVGVESSTERAAAMASIAQLSLSHLLLLNSFAELPSLWCDARECAGLPAVEVRNRLLLPGPKLIKRTIDLVLTLVGGLLIMPVLLVIAVLIKLTSPGPVFFGHSRVGLHGKKFNALKFRSMKPKSDQLLADHLASNSAARAEWDRDHKLKHDPRITPIGRVLRKTSLDELPQIWNVFTGDMSLVGPRPIVKSEIAKYGEIFSEYTRVRPGITGLWQVSGRNNTTYSERISLDNYYVRNWSPWLDLHIIARTFQAVFGRGGAY